MAESDQDRLFKKLDAILLALLAAKGGTRREQIQLLACAKLAPREIAELLGTTANAVSVELNRIRAGARSRRPRAETTTQS